MDDPNMRPEEKEAGVKFATAEKDFNVLVLEVTK